MTLLCAASPAWACPYCVGKDKDDVTSTLVIVAMVSVPFFIVAATGVLIRRANQDIPAGACAPSGHDSSEVC